MPMIEKLRTVENALAYCPMSSLTHEERFRVLVALKGLDEDGVQLCARWMQKDLEEVRSKFRSIRSQKVGLGSLFYIARQKGWEGDKDERFKALFQLSADRTINARYITDGLSSQALEGAKIIGIRSEKGTGKTEFIERVLLPLVPDNELVISVGHRRTLLSQAAKRLGLDYYQDIEGEKLINCSKLAITLDSLPKLSTKKMRTDIGMVIIDEASQVFSHLLGDTVAKERWNVQTTLTYLIRKARYVILLDADLSDVEVDFVASMSPKAKVLRVVNEFQYQGREATGYQEKSQLLMKLQEFLSGGESCYVTCSTKETADDVYRLLSPLCQGSSRLITSAETQQQETQEFIRNIGEEAANYQLIVASPSLGTGVDIQHPFDHVALLAPAYDKLSHSDLLQQMWRVRNPKNVHVWIDPFKAPSVYDYEVLREVALDAGAVVVDFNAKGERVVLRNDHEERYLDLWAKNKAKHNISVADLRGNFFRALFHAGWAVEWFKEELPIDGIEADLKEIRKSQRELKEALIMAAPKIDRRTYEEWRNREDLTTAQQYALVAYHIRRTYNTDEITPDLIKHFDGGKGALAVQNYLNLIAEDFQSLLSLDKQDYKHCFLPDIGHRAQSTKLREEILTLAFEASLEDILSGKAKTTPKGIAALEKFRRQRSNDIKVLLEITGKGTNLVKGVLTQLGLGLKGAARVSTGEGRFRAYRVAGNDFMQAVATAKLQHKEERIEEFTSTDF